MFIDYKISRRHYERKSKRCTKSERETDTETETETERERDEAGNNRNVNDQQNGKK